jgi:hypothetical protein
MRFKKYVVLLMVPLFSLAVTSVVVAKKPSRDVFGIRIGMEEEVVQKRLRKIATQQKEEKGKEEEGEQEVWVLKRTDRVSYVLTRFNRAHRLSLITVVAQPNRVRYSDIASVRDAAVVTDGRNFSYKWKIERSGERKASLLIARGSSSEYLTSYSLYPAKD